MKFCNKTHTCLDKHCPHIFVSTWVSSVCIKTLSIPVLNKCDKTDINTIQSFCNKVTDYKKLDTYVPWTISRDEKWSKVQHDKTVEKHLPNFSIVGHIHLLYEYIYIY